VFEPWDGIVDQVSWVTVAGVVTSCLSLSKNFASYASRLNSSTSTPLIFLTAFIAAGGRVLVCCLMPFMMVYNPVSGEWLKNTRNILFPVGTAVLIQIIFALCQFSFGLCKDKFVQKCVCPKKHVDSLTFTDVNKHGKPKQCATAFNFKDIRQRNIHEKTNCQKLLHMAVRSLVFSVTTDGHSHLGLWSSMCYVSWALWLQMDACSQVVEYQNATTTGLTLSMITFTMNTIVVLKSGQHLAMSLVVSLMLMIFPAYLYNTASTGSIEAWGGLIETWDGYDYDATFKAAIAVLFPIITSGSLIICVNIISVLHGMIKARKEEKEKNKMKQYFVQKMNHCNIHNEVTTKYQTI
ncbi:unnamed protein product, partial [Meganyctiphanes norvegica]